MLRVGEICCFLETQTVETIHHLTKYNKVDCVSNPVEDNCDTEKKEAVPSSRGSVY